MESRDNAVSEGKLIYDTRSWVGNNHSGVWAGTFAQAGTYSHEFAHLLGLPDMYWIVEVHPTHDWREGEKGGSGYTYTAIVDGWGTNILANTSSGTVETRNIQALFDSLPQGDYNDKFMSAFPILLPGQPQFAPLDNPLQPRP